MGTAYTNKGFNKAEFFENFLQDYVLNCVFEFFDIRYNIQEIK